MTEFPVIPALPLSDTRTDDVSSHTPTVRTGGSRRNLQIQWLRAIAAIMVMLYHSAAYQDSILHDGRFHAWFSDSFGYFGVALFFVISGYLMSIAIRVQTPFMFLAHRVIRIYPLYFLAALVFYGLMSALGNNMYFDPYSLLLMPLAKVRYPMMRVEWTLIFEIAFYVCLFVISWLGFAKKIVWIAIAWGILITASTLISPDDGSRLLSPIYQMLRLSVCLPMACGLLLPSLLKRNIPPLPLLALGLLPWVGYHFLPEGLSLEYEICRWLFGSSAVFILWGMIKLSQTGGFDFGAPGRLLAHYGDYSYALYLCHVPVISLVYAHPGNLSHWQVWMLSIVLALAASVALGRIDVGLYRRLKGRVERLRPVTVKRLVLAYFAVFVILSGQSAGRYFILDRLHDTNKAYAHEIMGRTPLLTKQDAIAAATAAGFSRSDAIIGHIDGITWDRDQKRLFVDLWALDRLKPKDPLFIALYRDGRLVAADMPIFRRADITQTYGMGKKTGYHFEKVEDCDPHGFIAVLFTPDRRFQVLDPVPPVDCAAP
jgi:peptidoglycan/LPS O-acetylase OafA/YrhL